MQAIKVKGKGTETPIHKKVSVWIDEPKEELTQEQKTCAFGARARRAIYACVRRGTTERPNVCSCGALRKTYIFQPDLAHPFRIRWLCKECIKRISHDPKNQKSDE